jgi:hypothetical protein
VPAQLNTHSTYIITSSTHGNLELCARHVAGQRCCCRPSWPPASRPLERLVVDSKQVSMLGKLHSYSLLWLQVQVGTQVYWHDGCFKRSPPSCVLFARATHNTGGTASRQLSSATTPGCTPGCADCLQDGSASVRCNACAGTLRLQPDGTSCGERTRPGSRVLCAACEHHSHPWLNHCFASR